MTSKLIKNLKSLYWRLSSKNTRKFILQRITDKITIISAFIWRRMLINTTFIAITGSVGKTTTKEVLADILEQKFAVMKTPGNSNLRRFKGLEMTILKTRPWHKFAVIEIGAEKPGDMESAAKFLKPDIVVIINVKRSHTVSFKTLDLIAQEKSQLLKYLGTKGCAILNQDNSYIAAMTVPPGAKVLFFGENESTDFHLLSVESKWPERLTLSISTHGTNYEVKTRLVGTHWAPTILAALSTANYCGVTVSDAINTIRSIDPFWSRMQPVFLPSYGATIIREDFHGQFDTFEAALEVMEEAHAKRKIVVFSDFSDSNMRSDKRAKLLGQMGARSADVAIFVGNSADKSLKAAIAEGLTTENVHAFLSTTSATDFLKNQLRHGDLVLIKGLMGHHLSRVHLGLIGDVTCSLETCYKQIGCDNCQELGFKWNPELKGLMAPPGSYV